MGRLIDLCGEDLVRKHLEKQQRWAEEFAGELENADQLRQRRGENRAPLGDNLHGPGRQYLEARARQAALEFALGAAPEHVCALYADGVEGWLPYVETLDWETLVEHKRQVYGAQIKRALADTGGELADDPRLGKVVRWYARPCYGAMAPDIALWAALLSGRPDLPGRVASVGLLQEPTQYQDMFGMVACLVKGDDAAATTYLQGCRGTYSLDAAHRVKREELPVGILHGDEEMIATGLKATTARYGTMWDPKRYKKTVKIGKHWKQPQFDSLEEKLRVVADDLLGLQWVLSEFALACMVLAVGRGLRAALADAGLWSEWVPRPLVLAAADA